MYLVRETTCRMVEYRENVAKGSKDCVDEKITEKVYCHKDIYGGSPWRKQISEEWVGLQTQDGRAEGRGIFEHPDLFVAVWKYFKAPKRKSGILNTPQVNM